MRELTTKFVNDDTVDGSLRIINVEGIQTTSGDIGDANVAEQSPSSFQTIIYDSPITVNRQVLLPVSGNYDGRPYTVTRTENATGAFDVVIRSNVLAANTEKARIQNISETADFVFSEAFGDWVLVN